MFVLLASCTSESLSPETLSDQELFKIVNDSSGKVYYQNGAILNPAGNSPHGNFKLHFNTLAASVLNADQEIPDGEKFPDGSLIAKEIFDGATLHDYALMYKHKGVWLWAEYKPQGEVKYSVTLRGAQCTGCHNDTPNRDKVRTFDLH
jgi:hypothetical protein